MTAFRIWLAIVALVLAGYTALVIADHGWNLLPVFFGDIGTMGWPGQFNLDFLFMLTLSGLWAGWRNHWGIKGSILAVLAFGFGAMFLSIYLMVLVTMERGDLRAILIGNR